MPGFDIASDTDLAEARSRPGSPIAGKPDVEPRSGLTRRKACSYIAFPALSARHPA
jgi:hypothetical protein